MRNLPAFDPTRDLAVMPGYQAVYAKECTLDDLIQLIKRFPIDNWLLHLSRLASLLAGGRHRPGPYADAFFRYIVPEKKVPKLASWFHDASARGNRAFIFADRHVGILTEMALLYAPSVAKAQLGPGGDLFKGLADAGGP